MQVDEVALGCGPGVHVAAIGAAQLGNIVAVVEEKYSGGVCLNVLNVGCNPSKALLRRAELAHLMVNEAKTFSVQVDGAVRFDCAAAFQRSRKVADGRVPGVHFLMKANGITELTGHGTSLDPHTLRVDLARWRHRNDHHRQRRHRHGRDHQAAARYSSTGEPGSPESSGFSENYRAFSVVRVDALRLRGELLMRVPGWIASPLVETVEPAAESAHGARGVEGNTRLTAATGMVLFVLLAVEGVTLLSVRQLITVHVFVGVLLLGPMLLKAGTTLYRFARYYTGAPAYTAKGPPHPVLRVIGPFVILSSLALLGTGIGLIFLGNNGSGWLLTAHQTCFWIWVALMTMHVLGHLFHAAATSWTELRASLRGRAARARRWRYAAIVTALVIGVGAATMLLPTAAPWTSRPAGHSSSPGSAQR